MPAGGTKKQTRTGWTKKGREATGRPGWAAAKRKGPKAETTTE